MGHPTWKEDDVQTLIQLWPIEKPQVVAERLGKTRNAIIGMANRLGLAPKALGRPRGYSMPNRARPKKSKPPKPLEPPKVVESGPTPLLKATAFQCKTVIDNMKDENGLAMVCGKPIVEGQTFSFCSEHLKRFTTNSNRGAPYVRNEPINKQLQ